MAEMVGRDRHGVVEELLHWFDRVAGGDGPLVVSIESPLGLGKTRLVQELYRRLAADRQQGGRYWPPGIEADDVRVLAARKRVEPAAGWVVPGGTDLPWLWWGISCRLTSSGAPDRALKESADQLRPHLDPLVAQISRAHGRKEDAFDILAGLFDLAGAVNPGAALDAGSKWLGVLRRRLQRKQQIVLAESDRQVTGHDDSYEAAERVAESLARVMRHGLPVVVAVDDAHWADPGVVSLLRSVTALEGVPLLVITTAWPERLRSAIHTTGTFAEWLATATERLGGRVERRILQPLPSDEIAVMIRQRAAKTPVATVEAIAEIVSGNPLTLSLLLDLDKIRRDIGADGSIDTDPAELRRLPQDLRTIYQELWAQLPDDVQQVLAMASVQGPEFLPGALLDGATALQLYGSAQPALVAAQTEHGWVRAVTANRYEFVERQRFEVAADNLTEMFDEKSQDELRRALVLSIKEMRQAPEWPDFDLRTRRLALENLLERAAELDDKATDAEFVVELIELAELELAAGNADLASTLALRAATTLAASTPNGPFDRALLIDARRVQSQALATAGRSEEAMVVLNELLEEDDGVEAGDTITVTELLGELEEDVATAPHATTSTTAGADGWGRLPWVGWTPRDVPMLTELPASELAALIVEVVEAEGPVQVGRVYDNLRVASGASRTGRLMRSALNRGLRVSLRGGDVLAFSPALRDPLRRVLRTPSQPEVVLREPGDRDPWTVPANELAALASIVDDRGDAPDRDSGKRKLAELFGWTRYTKSLDELFEAVLPATFGQHVGVSTDHDAIDKVRTLALRAGTAELYDELVRVGESHGLGRRTWPKSTTLTPPDSARYTLVYFGPRADGTIELGWSEENFERFLDIDRAAVESALGRPWQELDAPAAGEAVRKLDALLTDRGLGRPLPDGSADEVGDRVGLDEIDVGALAEAVVRRDSTFDTWDVIEDEEFRRRHLAVLGSAVFNPLIGRMLRREQVRLGIEFLGTTGRRGSALWRKLGSEANR